MSRTRSVVMAVACVTAGAVAGPPVVAGASGAIKDVLVVNGPERPLPTRAVGTTPVSGAVGLTGDTTAAVAAALNGTPVRERVTVRLPAGDTDHAELLYTVPAGKLLTVGTMNATVRRDMLNVSIEMICGSGPAFRWNGELFGPVSHQAAQWTGDLVAGPGCELHGFAIGADQAFATFSMTGVLRDAPAG